MMSWSPASSLSGAVHSAASTGYGGSNAATYQTIRPGYPEEVADFVLHRTLLSHDEQSHDGTPQRILDVGCGTGKWTSTLEAALSRHNIDHQLMAAEPVSAMAASFTEQLPHIPIHTTAASQLPFDDRYFDLLTAATAFHWFCDEASVASLHRILKPGGYFAILCYDLTVGDSWTPPMQQLFDSFYPPDVPHPRTGQWRRALDRAEELRMLEAVAHTVFRGAAVMRTNRAGLVNRFLSASAIAALESEEKERVAARFNAIIDADSTLAGKKEYVMKDDVEVTIVRRVAQQ